jgi:tRNA nucleotidyltransferase (CCA-adding enzyme)
MAKPLPQPVEVYRVGGSVRDELLGRAVADRDFVVVGATPEIMLASGFRPVGRDFPVFLHPETQEEYALARTERKRGTGHRGFAFFASPEVTLEEDLARRDLTINAMARDRDGRLIDPYGGARDLEAGVLRHVSPAFAEDPLRVLRVARFAARLRFAIAPETMRLMRVIVDSGELATLAPERVWQELSKGLAEPAPSRMIEALRESGALAALLPEVDALFHDPGAARVEPAEAGARLLRALDVAAARGVRPPVRYAVLLQTVPGRRPETDARAASRAAGVAERISARLRAPAEFRDLARLAARHRATVQRAPSLRPAEWLALFAAADALRRRERLHGLLEAAECEMQAGAGSAAGYPQRDIVLSALAAVRGVDAGAIAARQIADAAKAGSAPESDVVAKAVRAARLAALARWRRDREPAAPRRRR